MVFAIFVFDELEPTYRYFSHVVEIVFDIFNLGKYLCNEFVGFVFVEFKNTLHFDFHQSEDIIARDFTNESGLERLQPTVDMCNGSIHILGFLELLVLIDTLFNEDFFQRSEEKLFVQFLHTDEQFLTEQAHRAVDTMAQHVADGEEAGLVVFYNAAVRRYVDFAIAECVKRIYCLVRRDARCKVHLYLNFGRRIVVYLACLYLSLVYGFQNRVDKRRSCLAERYLLNHERLVVELLDLGSYFQCSASLSVVVFAYIDAASRGKVGINTEVFTFQIADGRIADIVQVVRKYLRSQSYGNTFCPLCKE